LLIFGGYRLCDEKTMASRVAGQMRREALQSVLQDKSHRLQIYNDAARQLGRFMFFVGSRVGVCGKVNFA
jgi:hypothetical protein